MSARRVFITGAASGLGRALAERYARAGARVCLADIDDVRGAEALAQLQAGGATAHYLHCDVTSEADFEAAADWLRENWGGVDIVVNNAGVAQMGAIDATPLADWRWIVDINLLGVVRGCRAFAPLLRAEGGGTLVNIASMAGLVASAERRRLQRHKGRRHRAIRNAGDIDREAQRTPGFGLRTPSSARIMRSLAALRGVIPPFPP